MNLELIKILGILIVTVCCILAAYTDVKRQIIPNELTFTTLIIGITLVSLYYSLINEFNLFYYLSIVMVFVFSYILWILGIWAGGDVKLFTAISSLLIPEFLTVIPHVSFYGITFPYHLLTFKLPTLLLIFNSVLSVIPVVLSIAFYNIVKNKQYLIDEIKKTIKFKEVFSSLNSLTISYIVISSMNVDILIVKLLLLVFLSYLVSKIMKYDIILVILSAVIIIQSFLNQNIILYLEEFILLSITIIIKNLYTDGIIKEALTNNIDKGNLKEGMILAYPLICMDDKYLFDRRSFLKKLKDRTTNGQVICSTNAGGLTGEDIKKISEIDNIGRLPIKKGLSFAPFILTGLFITLFIGNTPYIITMILELI